MPHTHLISWTWVVAPASIGASTVMSDCLSQGFPNFLCWSPLWLLRTFSHPYPKKGFVIVFMHFKSPFHSSIANFGQLELVWKTLYFHLVIKWFLFSFQGNDDIYICIISSESQVLLQRAFSTGRITPQAFPLVMRHLWTMGLFVCHQSSVSQRILFFFMGTTLLLLPREMSLM